MEMTEASHTEKIAVNHIKPLAVKYNKRAGDILVVTTEDAINVKKTL